MCVCIPIKKTPFAHLLYLRHLVIELDATLSCGLRSTRLRRVTGVAHFVVYLAMNEKRAVVGEIVNTGNLQIGVLLQLNVSVPVANNLCFRQVRSLAQFTWNEMG